MKKVTTFLQLIFFSISLSAQTNFEWVKQIGGFGNDYSGISCINQDGSIIVTGSFSQSVDMNPNIGINTFTAIGQSDIYISKFSKDGQFIWAKQIGGIGVEQASTVQIDSLGNIYIGGIFDNSVDFDPGIGIYNLVPSGSIAGFLCKLDSQGNFIWAKQYDNAKIYAMSIGHSSNIYVTGTFSGNQDFDPNTGSQYLNSINGNIFICKFDSACNLIRASQIGNNNSEVSFTLSTDIMENIYVGGQFKGSLDFDPNIGIYNISSIGYFDAYILKLDSACNFTWAKSMGGIGANGICNSISITSKNQVILSGRFDSTMNFDIGFSNYSLLSNGKDDIFLSKLDSNGNFIWAKGIGGKDQEFGGSVHIDSSEYIYLTGVFEDTVDFDPSTGIYQLFCPSVASIFICKFTPSCNLLWAEQIASDWHLFISSLNVASDNSMYITGGFEDNTDFDCGIGVNNLISNGGDDGFILKMSQWSTSIQNISECDNLIIYPNPTADEFNLEFNTLESGKYTVFFCSIDGKAIFSNEGSYHQGINKININLSNQVPSLYFINFGLNGQFKTFKLLKN
jgi:hypothetical protein